MTSSFNLLDEPWIQCAVGEERRELSLREVFQNLRGIRRLAGDSPTQDYAILRLLLAIFWRAHRKDPLLTGARKQTRRWWTEMFLAAADGDEEEMAELTDPVLAYLEEHRDRFDLLDPARPFMQVADLHTLKGEYAPVRRLVPDAESDYFTQRAGMALDALGLDEAARYLVALHAWDYSGIKSGAVGDPRVKGGRGYPIGTGWCGATGGVVLHGAQLAQTLVLNTPAAEVFGRQTEEDLPVWEQDPQGAAPRGVEFPAGPADVLTWQARRVRLFPEEGRVGTVLVSNGDRVERKNQFADPMTGYRWSRNQSSKEGIVVHMPAAHSVQRTLWRGVQALLVREGAMTPKKGEHLSLQPATIAALRDLADAEVPGLAETRIGVELVGMVYGTQDAVIEESIHEEIPLRLGVLMEGSPRLAALVIEAADATMRAAVNLGQFAGNLLRAAGGTYEFQEHVTDGVLQRLGDRFRLWLEELRPGADRQALRDAWFDVVEDFMVQEARTLQRGAGPKAMIGRIDEDRLVTSATAMDMLQGSLRKNLPRFRDQERAPQTQKTTAAADPRQIGATA